MSEMDPSPAPQDPAAPAAPPPPLPPSGRATGKGLRVALAVSVALNLGILGLGLGMAWHGGPGGHGDMMVRDLGFGPFTEALGPEDRGRLREAFFARMPDLRTERSRMRADAEAILTALRAQPFDPAALTAAMGQMQDHITQRMDLGGQLMVDFMASLTPEGRAAFADRLEKVLRRGPGGD